MNPKKKLLPQEQRAPKVPITHPGNLYEPADYLRGFDDASFFAILTRKRAASGEYKYKQSSYATVALNETLDYVREVHRDCDIWISQASFYAKSRQKRFFKSIGTLFCDLDTYKVADSLISGTPEEQTEQLMRWCDREELPRPSTVVFSGQGLQARWLLTRELPRQALKQWEHAQEMIFNRLEAIGADPRATDVCRVLRVVGSIHQETGEVVRVTHSSSERYDFDKLYRHLVETEDYCEPILDDAGQVTVINKKSKNNDQAGNDDVSIKTSAHVEKPITPRERPSNIIGLKQSSASSLYSARFNDLNVLAGMRWPNGIPSGHRDIFVFLASVFLCHAHHDRNKIMGALEKFCRTHVYTWSEEELLNSISASMKRLEEFIAGRTITAPNGQPIDPRYHFKNTTLQSAKWLGITVNEERQLKTILSLSENRRRSAIRSQKQRQEKGALDRSSYLDEKTKKREKAFQMRKEGKSWKDIASILGYKNPEAARRSVVVKKSIQEHPATRPQYIQPHAISPLQKKEREDVDSIGDSFEFNDENDPRIQGLSIEAEPQMLRALSNDCSNDGSHPIRKRA